MSHTPDGGPAFPKLATLTTHDAGAAHTVRFSAETVGGMLLRDYFAAKAMEALIPLYVQGDPEGWKTNIAKTAYNFADAMLRAREAK